MRNNNNNRGGNRSRFHIKGEKPAAKSTQRATQQKGQWKSTKTNVDFTKVQNQTVPTKPQFRLPRQEGGHCWNIYRVSNRILDGNQDYDVHGGLVLNEENDNVILVEVTHSPKSGRRNNLSVRNLVSTDLDENTGKPRNSYIKRKLVVSITTRNGVEGIDIVHLNKQMNDMQFTDKEKEDILSQLSHLSTAEERYVLFKDLAAKKKTDT